MTGHARLAVAASEPLERVLAGVRAAEGGDLVLDVDERSPLLLSLQHLHTLDEVAQEYHVRLTVATASSKILNAARVFGLDVLDTREAREMPPPAIAAGPTRLLAGEPLDREGTIAPDDAPQRDSSPADETPIVRLTPIRRQAAPVEGRIEEPSDDAGELPYLVKARTASRLDPYGQPYDDEESDAPTEAPRGRRGLRSLGIPERDEDTEEGWDDEHPQPRPTAHPGRFGGFWRDVRDWIEARRYPAASPAPAAYDAANDDDEAGWDDEPDRGPRAVRLAPVPTGSADTDGWDEGEDEGEGETPPAAAPRRRFVFGRTASHPAQDEDDEAGERREPTARLPIVPPVIAYADTRHATGYETHYEDEDEDEEERYAAAPQRERRRGPAPSLTGGLLFMVVTIAAALLIALYLLLPTATVTLAARTGQVTTDFRVVVAEIDPASPQGQPTNEQIVIPAKRLIVPLSATASRNATGTRSEPDKTAGGPVVLINRATAAVTVARGTTLTAANGREYVTQETITIGPADPLANTFGSVSVNVAATRKGSTGNAAIGAVSGQLSGDVFYINRNAPIAGGTDRVIATISSQDIAAASAAAEEAARGKGQAALATAIPAGGSVMHDTVGVGNFKTTANLQAGADGDSVIATTSAEVTALVYTPGAIEAQARAEAESRMAAAAKPGEPLVADSVQIAAPQLIEDVPGRLTYRMVGTAQTRAAIGSDSERAALARALAHQDDDRAHAILAALPGISSTRIDYHTGPFPQRMPWLASHITVRIAEGR
jgi:hypothetical protein